jgi:hypothetical protein
MPDRYERGTQMHALSRGALWDVGAEVHDARRVSTALQATLGGAPAVGEHDARVSKRSPKGTAAGTALRRAVQVATVDRQHERSVGQRAPNCVAGRHGIVGMDDVEGEP